MTARTFATTSESLATTTPDAPAADASITTAPSLRSFVSRHRATFVRLSVLGVLALAFAVLPSSTYAAGGDTFDVSGAATSTLTFVKKLWAFVTIAEVFAVIYYIFAYFTQSLFPALFQPVSGPWVKTAALIGVGGQFVMTIVVGMAAASTGGWT